MVAGGDGRWARGVGHQLSLAVDPVASGGRLLRRGEQGPEVARLDGTKWSTVTLDGAGKVGRNPSLAFGPDGLPLISYYAQTTQDLRLASFNGRKWYVTTIDAAGSVGQFSSLAISPLDGSWGVAYESQAENGGIKFAQRRRRSFSVATIALLDRSAGEWTSKPSLAFDGSGRAAVGYADPAHDAVRLALAARRGWGTVTVVSGGGVANDAVVTFDPTSGLSTVIYLDQGGAVKLARSTSAGAWSVSTIGQADSVTAAVNPVTRALAVVSGGSTTQVDAELAAPGAAAGPGDPRRVHETFVQWNAVGGATGYALSGAPTAGGRGRRSGRAAIGPARRRSPTRNFGSRWRTGIACGH